MRFKLNYFVIPGLLFLVALANAYINKIFPCSVVFALIENNCFIPLIIGEMALFSLWKSVPIIIFWNRFSHREAHFYPILGLFVLAEFLVVLFSFLTYVPLSDTALIALSFAPNLVSIIIVIGLWVHGLHTAAYWLISFLVFSVAIKITAYTEIINPYAEMLRIQLNQDVRRHKETE
jgi:hypothetical protein